MKLEDIRKEIDSLDDQILGLFLRRMELGVEAMREKAYCGKPLMDARREREILKRMSQKSGGLSEYSVRLFRELMSLSRDYQSAHLKNDEDGKRELSFETGNIIIIGMPGSGKSTVAKCIALRTGRKFINVDTEIELSAGKTIPEIFAQDGEPVFRDFEREETAKAGALRGAVIATGGGVIKDFRNYAPLHGNGRIYYLRRELEELVLEGRPLSKSLENLKILEKEREPFYARFADAEIRNDLTLEEAADRILEEFRLNTK